MEIWKIYILSIYFRHLINVSTIVLPLWDCSNPSTSLPSLSPILIWALWSLCSAHCYSFSTVHCLFSSLLLFGSVWSLSLIWSLKLFFPQSICVTLPPLFITLFLFITLPPPALEPGVSPSPPSLPPSARHDLCSVHLRLLLSPWHTVICIYTIHTLSFTRSHV